MERLEYCQKGKHLNTYERGKIEILLKEGYNYAQIARAIDRPRCTVTREIKRNSVSQKDTYLKESIKYFSDTAQTLYNKRRLNCGRKYKISKVSPLIKYVESKIKSCKWSPDTAIGHAKIEHPEFNFISTKTFYNYIDLGIVNVKPIDLLLKVRLSPKKIRVRKHKKNLGKSIEERPSSIEKCTDFGHWEMDTVVGIRKKAVYFLLLPKEHLALRL